MFVIRESVGLTSASRIIDTADTFEAAKAKVEAQGVAFMEDDADHAGCADAYMHDGRIVTVQPEGFAL